MRTIYLIKTDLKNIFRDPSLIAIFIAPIAIIGVLRFLPPLYEPFFPKVIEYRPAILGAFCLTVSALASYLLAFVMLDEKDQHLFHVFRVMPFTFPKLMLIRVLNMFLTSFILSNILIFGANLVTLNFNQIIILSCLCSLSGPANTLLVVSLSSNKIEGATYFKLLNMFIMAPITGIFILNPLKYLLGVFPFFWVFISFMSYNNPPEFYLHAGVGIFYNLLYLIVVYLYFLRKTSNE